MPNRVEATLAALATRGEGAFMPFLVLGDPDERATLELTDALLAAGADLLEYGFPFSDPPADGPVIQAADRRALDAGMTTARGFALLAEIRARTERPIALLVYYNLLFRPGVEDFVAAAKAAGVDAILVADLPLEEAGRFHAACHAHGVAPIAVVTSVTTPARAEALARATEGYIYVVAALGVTGARATLEPGLVDTIRRLRAVTKLPLLVGFGISTPAHVRAVLDAGADGAIVGSALVRQIEVHLGDPAARNAAVLDLARALKAATRRDAS